MKKKYKYDVFISHAFEDKDEIGNPLYELLCKANLKVWYSGKNIRVGENLTDTIIHEVIPESKYGVVIISNNYFKASWGRKELNALYSIEQSRGYRIILPVWHKVDAETVDNEFPYLVEQFAAHSTKGLEHVAAELIEVISKQTKTRSFRKHDTSETNRWLWWTLSVTLLFIFSVSALLYLNNPIRIGPPKNIIDKTINERIEIIEKKSQTDYNYWLHSVSARPVSFDNLLSLINNYTGPDNKCRTNECSFDNQNISVTGLKKVHALIGSDPVLGIFSAYSMSTPKSFIDTSSFQSSFSYMMINRAVISFTIEDVEVLNEVQAVCKVKFENGLRYVQTEIEKAGRQSDCGSMSKKFYGLKPIEEYVFEKQQNGWVFTGIKP